MVLGAVALTSLCTLALAGSRTADSDPVATIKKVLAERYPQPQAKVMDVQPAPVKGMYAAFLADNSIIYVDPTADYVFVGNLIDTRTRANVSRELVDARYPIDFSKLPFEHAIKIVKGDGSRQVAVFEDPDCPFCHQFESDLRGIDNVTEYVFLYPLKELHPQAEDHARAIWCSQDRASAWIHWMLDNKSPDGQKCEGDPIAEVHSLAEQFHIDSTPTLVFANNKRIHGAPTASDLQAALAASGSSHAASATPDAVKGGG